MKEIEVKFRVKDLKGIIAQIKKIGGVLKYQGIEISCFFDTVSGNLSKKGQALRLRKLGNDCISLTFKGKALEDEKFKAREELEVLVSDFRIMEEILKQLEFVDWFRYSRYRQYWQVEGAVIELDILGWDLYYIKIEASETRIKELAEQLGLDWNCATTKTYVEILREMGK